MALVKDKDGNTKEVTDFIAANSQLLKKYGYTPIVPLQLTSPTAQPFKKIRKSCCS